MRRSLVYCNKMYFIPSKHTPHVDEPLDESDHAARDILIKAILEAKKGLPEGGGLDTWKWAPEGVVENTKWWVGRSFYHSGRAPMARLVELPDDVLRCICEQLVPLVPPERKVGEHVLQSDDAFIAESRAWCEENSTPCSSCMTRKNWTN